MLKQYPFYLKSTVILFGLVLIVYSFKNLEDILQPLAFAGMFAILLNPLVNLLRRYKVGNTLSILIALLAAMIVGFAIFYFLSSQISAFTEAIPALKERLNELLANVQKWMQQELSMDGTKQVQSIKEGMGDTKIITGSALTTVAGMVSILILIPVYTFLFIYYKNLLIDFLFKVFAEKNSKHVDVVLTQTKGAIQSYMIGLLLDAAAVSILNTIALLIIGVKYALLLGILGGLLNILPYIGGIVAIALPVLTTTATSEGFTKQLWIIVAYLVIQLIDNYILVPRIVSSKVKLNALISIIAVLLGGALWGIGGMFLSIPFVAILKIIFDRIAELKPWGQLLGDEVPTAYRRLSFRKKKPASA